MSYVLSVPELPSHTIDVAQTREPVARNMGVPLSEHVANLPEDLRLKNAKLDQRRDGSITRYADDAGRVRPQRAGSVLVDRRCEEMKVAGRKAIEERCADIKLTASLVLGSIEP